LSVVASFTQLVEEACRACGCDPRRLSETLGRTPHWYGEVMRAGNMTERVFRILAHSLGLDLRVSLLKRGRVVAEHTWKHGDPIDATNRLRKNHGKRSVPRRAAREARGFKTKAS
jgi:hypothetical protein